MIRSCGTRTALSRELCADDRAWDASPTPKRPDLSKLSEALQDHELDGRVLLTYENYGGYEAFQSLCKDLLSRKYPIRQPSKR